MKKDNLNYMLVGTFVAVMIVAFLVLLFAVTGRSGPTDSYYVYYDNVSGLKFGTGVFYEGYRVGQIENVTPESTDAGMRYKIELSVKAGWKIPVDSVASVASSGLISAITVQIDEGEASSFLKPGDTIIGRGQSDLFAVINQAATDFRALSQDGILPVMENLNARITELTEEIVGFRRNELTPFVQMMHKRLDEDLISEAVELLDHLDASAQGLQALLGSENRERIESFLIHVDDVAVHLNELVERIESTRMQMNGVLDSLGAIVEENRGALSSTVSSAEVSTHELELALKTINQHLGVILYNLEGGSRHMSEFARTIRENPSRLIRKSTATEPGSP
jgi:phospholipid/cholesterol/gamma-HCH transport system substrate-binding protein